MNASNDCSPPIETTEFTLVLTPIGTIAAGVYREIVGKYAALYGAMGVVSSPTELHSVRMI